jgi:hypothetical protein
MGQVQRSCTPLQLACARDDLRLAQWLVSVAGADPRLEEVRAEL